MACLLQTRDDVSKLVIGIFTAIFKRSDLTENTSFTTDLGNPDAITRRAYYFIVKPAVVAEGCSAGKLSPDAFGKAETLGDIVDDVWHCVS